MKLHKNTDYISYLRQKVKSKLHRDVQQVIKDFTVQRNLERKLLGDNDPSIIMQKERGLYDPYSEILRGQIIEIRKKKKTF